MTHPRTPVDAVDVEAAWQNRWDQEWLRIRQADERLAQERAQFRLERRQATTQTELGQRELAEQWQELRQERAAWRAERTRLQTELETLHAEAFNAWEDLRTERQGWDAQRDERLIVGQALVDELQAIDQRVVHQRKRLGRLQADTRNVELGLTTDWPALTIHRAADDEPDVIAFVTQAWQDAADLMGLLAERQQLLESLQRFWLNEWDSAGAKLAEREEAVECQERLLAGRERWLGQRGKAVADGVALLAESWQCLVTEKALFALERDRHDALRKRLILAVKERVRQADEAQREGLAAKEVWERECRPDSAATTLEQRQAELLTMNAGLQEERQVFARERHRLRGKMNRLKQDRALLRREVNLLREQVEHLATALVQGDESLPMALQRAA